MKISFKWKKSVYFRFFCTAGFISSFTRSCRMETTAEIDGKSHNFWAFRGQVWGNFLPVNLWVAVKFADESCECCTHCTRHGSHARPSRSTIFSGLDISCCIFCCGKANKNSSRVPKYSCEWKKKLWYVDWMYYNNDSHFWWSCWA